MLKKRDFTEMFSYFNSTVSQMDIDQKYKLELLGMITAIAYEHSKTQAVKECEKGEWIDFTMADFGLAMEQCGACKGWSLGMGKKFCPHCGARNMKGE